MARPVVLHASGPSFAVLRRVCLRVHRSHYRLYQDWYSRHLITSIVANASGVIIIVVVTTIVAVLGCHKTSCRKVRLCMKPVTAYKQLICDDWPAPLHLSSRLHSDHQ